MEGIGVTQFWGCSPAIDLQYPVDTCTHYCKNIVLFITGSVQGGLAMKLVHEKGEESNFLVAGGGDITNVLKTFCRAWRWPKKRLNVCIILQPSEIILKSSVLCG